MAQLLSHLLTKPQRLLLPALLLLLMPPVHAQTAGITVGQPKVYDNQSLTIMLDQLNTQLSQVRAVDQSSLQKALGLIQGSQEQDVASGLTASASSPATGASPSAGSALPDLLPAPSYKPDYGENSLDLLSDQVDLSYQIFNLRMLLERSVTDRLQDGQPRRQAVISFNITLDPPKDMAGAAAYVEITLTPSNGGPLSLVASMPQEKTYNATSLSSSSHAFGGAAVAQIVSVSYNQRRRKQIFFLYRDSDTLALERPASAGALTFGWVFRPVLGRQSVSAGMRQMFAVVALPDTDLPGAAAKEGSAPPVLHVQAKTYWLHYDQGTATVTSKYPGFWHWSAKPLPEPVSSPLSDIPTLSTESLEQGLGATVANVRAFQTTDSNTMLQITGTNFFPGTTVKIGDKTFSGPQDGLFLQSAQTMLLTAGTDLLTGALSALVNGRYGPPSPLYPKASPAGILIAKSKLSPLGPNYSTLELMMGDARPGHDLTLQDIQGYPDPILTLNGVRIPNHADFNNTTDSGQKYVIATVRVPNSLLQPQGNRVGMLFPLLGESWSAEGLIYDSDAVQVTKMTAGKTTTLLISRPGQGFAGNWRLVLDKTYPLTDEPAKPETANKSGKNAKPNHAPEKRPGKNSGAKEEPEEQLVEFSRLLPCKDPNTENDTNRCTLVRVVADTKFLADYQKFVLVSPDGYAQLIDLSASPAKEAPASNPALKVSSVEPATVGLNEVVTVMVTGVGLDAVKQVSFDGKPLTFWKAGAKSAPGAAAHSEPSAESSTKPAQGPTQLEVLLDREITGKEGRQTFLLEVDDKTVSTALITVARAPTMVAPAGKNLKTTEKAP
jgi:hypothetical protein